MTWPRDDTKLDRVRALMAEHDLDALVVRAPDNVLYLTNFWGMKGYDACVFPREGEPVLITIEASEEDAARTAWTNDVRFVKGYAPDDPRPVPARTLDAALDAARDYGRVGLELSHGHAGVRPDGRRADHVHEGVVRRAGRPRSDAMPVLNAARAIKTRAGARAHAPRERHLRGRDAARPPRAPPGDEGERGGRALAGFVHGEGTGWQGKVELALGFSLVWSGAGIKTFTATGDLPVQPDQPTLFEIWVCADGYWCDHTKLLCPGELRDDYRELERGLMDVYARAIDHCKPGASLAELDRLVRYGIDELGYPGQPSHPICHGVGARAHEPPYAHQAGGGDARRGNGAGDRAGVLLGGRRRAARRGQLPDHRRRRREAVGVPGRRGDVSDLIWTGPLNDRYAIRGSVGLYDTTLRDGEQTVGVVLGPEDKLEIARLLDELGVDRIEAGFPRVSDDDWRAVELISQAGLGPRSGVSRGLCPPTWRRWSSST